MPWPSNFSAFCRNLTSGETGTRTRDTMIFSHVLYQLSYLAVRAATRSNGASAADFRVQEAGYQGRRLLGHLDYSSFAKRFSSKVDSTISLGSAPTTALGCSPGSKRAMVGMLEIPK